MLSVDGLALLLDVGVERLVARARRIGRLLDRLVEVQDAAASGRSAATRQAGAVRIAGRAKFDQ